MINILWPFDLNTNDFYNTYNGIPTNNPSYVPSPVSTTAIHFQSSSQQSVEITQPPLKLTHTSFPVECWIHPISLSTYDNAIFAQCQNSSPQNCFHLGIRNATLFMNYYKETLKGISVLKANNWYHVAFVFDALTLQLTVYLNGKQDATKKVYTPYQGTNDIITIGTSKISRIHHTHFNGYMDQLSVVSKAKSAEDILLDATTIPLIRVKGKLPPGNCQALVAIIEQQANSIEHQVAMTRNILQMSMETVSAMWKQQQAQRICENNMQPPTSAPITSNTVSAEKLPYDFTPPHKLWCPWKSDCTQILNQRGQMTIEMDQHMNQMNDIPVEQQTPLPFELHMSISEKPENTSYILHFSINDHDVSIYKTIRGSTTFMNQTTDEDYVLHKGKGKYWLSIDYDNLFIKYGQGEVRDRCTLLKSDIPNIERDYVRKIQYAHISFNRSRDLTQVKMFEQNVKLKIGRNPVVDDPALIVVTPNQYTLDHIRNNNALPITRLNSHCQNLYYDVINWKFQDESFPHFYEAIEHSSRNPTGWCCKRLLEKSNRFGQPNILATYLRITIGRNRGTSPGVPYVLEIWPPGHYSPIHAHANTHGIIRVLYGEINVKIYRSLSLKKKKPIHETKVHENQVTWLSPGLNQIHQLENKSNKTCITIQAYEYVTDEVSNYEYFDYITNDGESIRSFDPVSDINFFDFQNLMKDEWNSMNE
ncbi:unnamed protein product [Rotaria sp. Silwood2]|nr:unnamed protein product [Rotaria sp. Silwood2]CAF4308036.1 unnamed protein product [Rotaria sp. Silwood2]